MGKILQHKFLVLSVFCVLLSGIVQILYQSSINRIPNNIIINVDIENNIEDIDAFLESLEISFNNVYLDSITFDTQVQNGNKVVSTATHQIYGSYLQSNNINIFKGRYLNYSDNKDNNYALIDDKLAFILFRTYNCIGEEILIDGKKYFICGITESPKMKYQFSVYNIYIPLDKIQSNNMLIASVTPTGTGIQSARKIETYFSNYGNYDLYNAYIHKLRKEFWVYLAICSYLVILTIVSIRWLKLALKKLIINTKNLLDNKYLSDIYLWLALRSSFILSAIVVIITLLYLSFNKLSSLAWSYGDYIPQSLLKWEYIKAIILKIYINTNLDEPIKTIQQIQLTSINIYIYFIVMSLCLSVVFYILWRRKSYSVLLVKDKNES